MQYLTPVCAIASPHGLGTAFVQHKACRSTPRRTRPLPLNRSELGQTCLMPAKRKSPLSMKKGASAAARHDSKALSAAERGAQRATAAALEHEDVVDQARKRRRTRPKSPDAKAQSERRAKAVQRRLQRVTAQATAAAVAIAKAAVEAPGSILATALPINTDVDVEGDQVHGDTDV